MAREHELLFKINAQMNGAYRATFRDAQAAMGSLRDEYNSLASTVKDIAAYERQAQAVENTKAKLELLQQQYANIQREISETGGFSSDLENKLTSKQHQIDKTTEALQNQTDKLSQYEAALQQAGVDTSNLEGESKRLEGEMDNMRRSFDEAGKGAEEMSASATDALMDLEGVLVGAGIVKMTQELAELLRDCADASMEFEVGMASVRRTVGGSEEEMAALGDEFQRMAATMPITISELTEIATTAGQLGIAQENVRDFTQVMAELATTTDLSADRAATLLAQFSNITGTTDYDRLGSTVAALGDSTATTASRIVEMSQGMAAAATVAGMSAQDVLGISAAVGALGGRTQTGATAMSQLITKIQLAVETGEGLEGYAKTAGLTAQEFKRAWGEDAAGALNTFIQGLNDTEQNGKSALAVLNDLGITNARQLRVFTNLAQSGDLLTRTIDMANQSWTENTALQEKAGIMYDTTQAKMTTMQNEVNNLRIAIGDQFNPALGRLYEKLGDIAGGLANFAENNPEVVRALGSLAIGLAVTTAGLGAYTAAAIAAKVASDSLAGPIGWLDLGITALAASLGVFALTADEAEDVLHDTQAAIRDMEKATTEANASIAASEKEIESAAMTAGIYINRLKELEEAGTATGESQEEYRATVDELNRLIPGLNAQLDEQTGLVRGGTAALLEQTDAWKQNALVQATYEANTEKIKAWAQMQLQVIEAEKQRNEIERDGVRIAEEIEKKELSIAEAQRLRKQLTEESCSSAEEFFRQQSEYDDLIGRMQADIAQLTQDQATNRSEMEAAEKAFNDGSEAMAKYEQEIQKAQNGIAAFIEANHAVSDSMEEITWPIDEVIGDLERLAASYEEEYAKCLEVIQNQFGLWEEAPDITSESVADMQKALESQASYWDVYSANLESLSKRNIEGLDALVKSMGDGTTKGAGYIAALNAASDEEIRGIISSWEALQKAQGKAADEVEGVKSEFDTQIDALSERMRGAAKEMEGSYEARIAATRTVQEYINTASYLIPKVQAAYQRVAQSAMDALQYANMTVITRHGENIGRVGYAEGTDNATPGVHLVGEQGPELVWFNGGEQVTPARKTVELLTEATQAPIIKLTMNNSYKITGVEKPNDFIAALEEYDRSLQDKILQTLASAERDRIRRSYN